jgi:hypothetical protein
MCARYCVFVCVDGSDTGATSKGSSFPAPMGRRMGVKVFLGDDAAGFV